ncbi:MAG: response regulator [Lachnospiraceae bacterium]|nr:response regulator [Lachnospiraceae bacterium]
MSDALKVVVVDDSDERRYQIRETLPDYMEASFPGMGELAKRVILPDANTKQADLVILNADDATGHCLELFRWMREEEPSLMAVPVLLLCADAYDDRVMSFLEIGDADYYEGEINGDLLFMQMMEMIDAAEMAPEYLPEPSFTEKDPARAFGISVKPLGEDEDTIRRSIVLQHEEQLKQLDEAVERGRKKQEKIKEILDLAIKYKEEKKLETAGTETEPVTETEKQTEKEADQETGKGPATVNGNADGEEVNEEKKRTVVIVDYDLKNRKLCELFLKTEYNVVVIDSAMSAIDYFVRSKADILLLSYQMPILSGVKILDSIRWQQNGKRVPVIFMTEDNPDDAKRNCRNKERVVGILTKPVSKGTLKRSVSAVLSTLKG